VRRKHDSDLVPLELSILATAIALKRAGSDEFHGYAIARELRGLTEARRLTAHGTLYRALERLEQRGLLESRLEDADSAAAERRPRRRLYSVTALGVRAAPPVPADVRGIGVRGELNGEATS
jgi:PadR family transcriptional regulator PadR